MKWENSILKDLEWNKSIKNKEEKKQIADQVARLVQDGDIIGVGSGSTSYMALKSIAERVHREHLSIRAIPTSLEMQMACAQFNIPVTHLLEHKPNWSFDGADEVDPKFNLIKGRGGAMFKEKLLIKSSPRSYILADSTKIVTKLGMYYPVPVEIFPKALTHVEQELYMLDAHRVQLRMAEGKDGPIFTENGNLILDVWFDEIPSHMESSIKCITGVIESGLFINYKIDVIGISSIFSF